MKTSRNPEISFERTPGAGAGAMPRLNRGKICSVLLGTKSCGSPSGIGLPLKRGTLSKHGRRPISPFFTAGNVTRRIESIFLRRVPHVYYRCQIGYVVSHLILVLYVLCCRPQVSRSSYRRKIDTPYRIEGVSHFISPKENWYTVSHCMGYSIPITDGNQCTVSHRRGFPIFITDGKSIHRIASKGVHRIPWKGLLPIHRIEQQMVPHFHYRRKIDTPYRIV